jgi:hypothetical protein
MVFYYVVKSFAQRRPMGANNPGSGKRRSEALSTIARNYFRGVDVAHEIDLLAFQLSEAAKAGSKSIVIVVIQNPAHEGVSVVIKDGEFVEGQVAAAMVITEASQKALEFMTVTQEPADALRDEPTQVGIKKEDIV